MEKISPEKIYHIYLKDNCVLHSLCEENFKTSWDILNTLVGLMKTDYTTDDLSYEVVSVLKTREEHSY